MHPNIAELVQHFGYSHLPDHLQAVSRPFGQLAEVMATTLEGPEATVCLRKLLEAKDCAVRAVIAGRRAQREPELAPPNPAGSGTVAGMQGTNVPGDHQVEVKLYDMKGGYVGKVLAPRGSEQLMHEGKLYGKRAGHEDLFDELKG